MCGLVHVGHVYFVLSRLFTYLLLMCLAPKGLMVDSIPELSQEFRYEHLKSYSW